MDFKEMYIEEVERLASLYEEEGLDPNLAYEKASGQAYDAARDRLAEKADYLRMIKKEENL
jgi:hypothetical protein